MQSYRACFFERLGVAPLTPLRHSDTYIDSLAVMNLSSRSVLDFADEHNWKSLSPRESTLDIWDGDDTSVPPGSAKLLPVPKTAPNHGAYGFHDKLSEIILWSPRRCTVFEAPFGVLRLVIPVLDHKPSVLR